MKSSTNIEMVYTDTQRILCLMKENIENSDGNVMARLGTIFDIAHLKDGISFIQNRIQNIIERIVFAELQSNDNDTPKHLRYKLLLADEVIRELQRYGGLKFYSDKNRFRAIFEHNRKYPSRFRRNIR